MDLKSVPKLDSLFYPSSLSVIGASPKSGTIGNIMLQNFIDFGFSGKIYPVNPKYEEISGLKTYPSVTDVPEEIDLAVIVVQAKIVPDVVRDCIQKDVPGIVIVSGGFSETGRENFEQKILNIINGTGTRIVGPNCMGVYCPESGVTYESNFPRESGLIGFISQSGGIGELFTHLGSNRGMRINKLVSSGNETDLKFVDYLKYFAKDPDIKVVSGYVEQIRKTEEFKQVAPKISQNKPIVIWKAGKEEAGKRAVESHTNAMAGTEKIYESIFKQTGVIKAENLTKLINYTSIFSCLEPVKISRIGVITGPGGLGVGIVDELESEGFEVPAYSENIQERLQRNLPSYAQTYNPVDLTFAIAENPSMVKNSIEVLMDEEKIDAIVVASMDVRPEFIMEENKNFGKPVFCVAPYFYTRRESVRSLVRNGIPVYSRPEGLAKSLAVFEEYSRYLEQKNNS